MGNLEEVAKLVRVSGLGSEFGKRWLCPKVSPPSLRLMGNVEAVAKLVRVSGVGSEDGAAGNP